MCMPIFGYKVSITGVSHNPQHTSCCAPLVIVHCWCGLVINIVYHYMHVHVHQYKILIIIGDVNPVYMFLKLWCIAHNIPTYTFIFIVQFRRDLIYLMD